MKIRAARPSSQAPEAHSIRYLTQYLKSEIKRKLSISLSALLVIPLLLVPISAVFLAQPAQAVATWSALSSSQTAN